MEHDTETETCSSVINNEIKNRDVEAMQESSIENKYYDDDDDDGESIVEVEIDKEEITNLSANINLHFNKFCDSDESSWHVQAGNYLTAGDIDVLSHSKELKNDHKNDQPTLGIKKKLIISSEKLDDNFCDKGNAEEHGISEKSTFPITKKLKRPQDEDVHNSKISYIDNTSQESLCNELLGMKVKPGLSGENILNQNIKNDQVSNETNLTSKSSSKLHDYTHLTADIYGPSCSKNFPSLSSPSSSNSPDSLNTEKESKYLFDLFKECFLKDSVVPMQVPEDVKVVSLEECDYVEAIRRSTIENDNELLDISNEAENYVDDPDIINPEVMYNIDLFEHLKMMEILVKQISESPDDPTLLNRCLSFPPIPQVEHEPKTFTAEERFMFMNGISEWDYKIDRDDWNKIMVKRACIFTSHAGFDMANEESLYVLADVATDYIKKLAVALKKNFDLQSISSYPDSIDPLNLSLQEIGVKGGIKEVVDHYKNDIFGRRDKLMKKCQYLQKVISEYVESMQLNNLKDKETQSLMDKIQDPVCIDNTEPKMDINSSKVQSIKTDATETRNKQLNNPTTVGTKEMQIDLLKSISPDKNECSSVLECFEKVDKETFLKEYERSCSSESYSDREKKGKLLDMSVVERMMADLYQPSVEKFEPNTDDFSQKNIRIQKEFENDFKKFKNSRKRRQLLKYPGTSKTDQNVTHDNSTPTEKVLVSENSGKDEAHIMDTNDTITVIDDNLDDNLVSMQPKSLNDP